MNYGASLKSLEELGSTLGYRLVGCHFSGVNAFFVREDLVASSFCHPFTADNHYEPPREFLDLTDGRKRKSTHYVKAL